MARAIMTGCSVVYQFCVVVFLQVARSAALNKCRPGYFFDDVLQKCENCYAVCNDASLQRTEDICALCKDGLQPKSGEHSHVPSPETTPTWVVAVAIVIVFIMMVAILITAFIKRRPLQRICRRLQATLSLQDIREEGSGPDVEDGNPKEDVEEDELLPANAMVIENPQHDPQNMVDYQQQIEVDLKKARLSQKNVQTGNFAAPQNGQITSLVHAELQDSMKMGPDGIDIQETMLKIP